MIDYLFNILSVIFSLVASFFAVKCIGRTEGRDRLLLSLMLVGTLTFALGEIIFSFLELTGLATFPSVADIFFVIGSLGFVLGLFYFWMTSPKSIENLNWKDFGLFTFFIIITSLILGYIFFYLALPSGLGAPLESFLNIFYPVSSAFTFLQVFLLRNHFKESKLSHFFEYFSDGIFFLYVGDMMFAYSEWSGVSGLLTVAYNGIFMLGYALIALAFFVESKRSARAKWDFKKIE